MDDDGLGELPDLFTYSQARKRRISDRKLRSWRDDGLVEIVSRGLYRRTDSATEVDIDLVEIATRVPDGTLCLTTALSKHGLTDQIPSSIDVAIPRGHRTPKLVAPVTWHHFARDTFTVGRESLPVTEDATVGIYTPERCIIDAFRLRHQEGSELAVEALRAWLRRKGSRPASLMAMADPFPQATPALRSAMEVLL